MFCYPNPCLHVYVMVVTVQMLIVVVSGSLPCLGVTVYCEGKCVSKIKVLTFGHNSMYEYTA